MRVERVEVVEEEGREEGDGEVDWKGRVAQVSADADAEREGRVRAEAMVVELARRWEEGRVALRRMRVRVAEYERLMEEVDRVRVEDELMAVRERAVMSSAVYGLAEEVASRVVMERHKVTEVAVAEGSEDQQLPLTPAHRKDDGAS